MKLFKWFSRDEPEEIPYRVVYEPGGFKENNDGSITSYTLKKSYGYWGDILKVEVEKNTTRF